MPNKNSVKGIVEKNLFDSKITDNNIPIVINIAKVEQANKNNSIIFSNLSLALNSFFIFLKVKIAVKININIDIVNKIILTEDNSGKMFFSNKIQTIINKTDASKEFKASIAP